MKQNRIIKQKITCSFGSLSYLDNGLDGSVIIFIHGNSYSSKTFNKQFTCDELSSYRLIALDLPGHGESDRANGGDAYSLPFYREVLKEFVKKLQINSAVFVGHSLGGHVLLECLEELPCAGALIYGTPPVGKNQDMSQLFLPNKDLGLFFKGELTREEAHRAIMLCYSNDFAQGIDEEIQDLLMTDPRARELLGKSLAEQKFKDEVLVVMNTEIPLGILTAEMDKIINNQYFTKLNINGLWEKKVHSVKNAGHNIHREKPFLFNQYIRQFSEYAFRQRQSLKIQGSLDKSLYTPLH